MSDIKRLLLKYITKRDKLEYQLEEVNHIIESLRNNYHYDVEKNENQSEKGGQTWEKN